MKNFTTLVLFSLCCISMEVLAQSDTIKSTSEDKKRLDDYSQEELFSLSLDELMSIQVTVASKSEESWMDAPSSVTVYSQAEISNMGVSSIQELLNYVPGFLTTLDIEQGKAHRVSARGRSTALSESILFLINGQRINDLYTGGISFLNRLISIENVKQVEIIRGPGSALYGSNAFLGVVNIVTIDYLTNFSAQVGSQGSRNAHANFSKSVTNNFSVSGFVKAFSDNGYEFDNVTDVFGRQLSTFDAQRGVDLSAKVSYKGLTINSRHMERQFEGFYPFGAISDLDNKENTKQSSFTVKYEIPVSDKLSFNLSSGYLTDRWNTQAVAIPKGIEIAPDFVLTEDFVVSPVLESYNTNFSADAKYKVNNANEFIAGLSVENTGITKVQNRMTHNPITLDYLGGIEVLEQSMTFNETKRRNIVGLYAQDKHTIGENLNITLGVRYDQYNDFGKSLNPRGAIVYSTNFDSKIKLIYGQAFRAPNFLELYDKNNPVDFGNPDLNAEQVKTLEFVYVQKLSFLTASFTAFQNDIKNMIELADPIAHENNPLEAPAFINNDKNIIFRGLEMNALASPFKNFLLNMNYTYMFDKSEFFPGGFGSVSMNYRFSSFNANVKGLYRGEVEALPNQDAYLILSSSLRYAVKNQKLILQAKVDNITNNEYKTVSAVLSEGVINRGRTFSLGAEITF